MSAGQGAESPALPHEHDEAYVPTEAELERSIEGVRRGIESMRSGESLDAREALTALRKELFPNAPPRDFIKP